MVGKGKINHRIFELKVGKSQKGLSIVFIQLLLMSCGGSRSHQLSSPSQSTINLLKFGYSEEAAKFEKKIHLKFDATQ